MTVAFHSWRDLVALPPWGPKARAVLLAFGAVTLWATWPTLATWARPAPPFLVLALGSAVGFALSLARAAGQGEARAFLATPPRTLAFVAAGLLVNNILYLMAMPRIGPAEANVISYLWPILLVLILSRMDRSQLRRIQWLGILTAFAGAALAIGPTFAGGFDLGGAALAFASGLAFAIYAAIRSRGQERADVIGPSMGVIAVLSMILHCAFEAPAALAPSQLVAIAAIGVAPLTLSNALWDRASRTGQMTTISAIAYLTPLVGLLLLSLTGVAAVTWGTAVGAVLIVAGALAASRTTSPRA
jgi:drug/metabolite transporter (DMT)-like permease